MDHRKTAKSRAPFLRRTKATAPPDTEDESATKSTIETTTNKYTRRGISKFKSRKELAAAKKNEIENGTRRPSLSTGGARSERPRSFVRRRLGGANATSTTSLPSSEASPPGTSPPSSSATTSSATPTSTSRRPFRIASRRRPSTVSSTTSTTSKAPTTVNSEESLQDIEDTESIEDPELAPKFVPKSTVKIQRRPLVSLKDEARDQNPSATNEQEPKRHSKKYSSSINQNQLDELKKSKSQEETSDSSTFSTTTAQDNDAETALAIAAHALLSAPIPNLPNYDEEKTVKKTTRAQTAADYSYTPQYTDYTEPKTIYSEDFSTPNYESTSLRNKDYISTTIAYEDPTTGYAKTTYNPSRTTFSSTPVFLSSVARGPISTPSVPSQGLFGGSSLGPSTAKYFGGSDKFVSVPVEEFRYSTSGYTRQEPSYFTREYLLESPVTKTYDDEYQYLSPVTTPQTTRRPVTKTIQRKISTTLAPTPTPAPATTPKPRRIPSRKFEKPFEKIQKDLPNRTYRPIDNYDYYDDGSERVAEKYGEGTKVVLHGKGTIECLDIGNFPHPSSCKKFISCARIENGSLLGWEYICPKGLSFDPVGGICNWSAGLGCDEKDI